MFASFTTVFDDEAGLGLLALIILGIICIFAYFAIKAFRKNTPKPVVPIDECPNCSQTWNGRRVRCKDHQPPY